MSDMGRGLIARWGLCRDALLFMLVVELYASGRDRRRRSNEGCMLMSHKRTGGVYVKKSIKSILNVASAPAL